MNHAVFDSSLPASTNLSPCGLLRAVIKDLLLLFERLEGAVFSSEKADPFEDKVITDLTYKAALHPLDFAYFFASANLVPSGNS